MSAPLCYLNGKIVPLAEAKVGVLDLGMVRGFGIYEGITAFSEKPFRFNDHWERFEISAGALGLVIPKSKDEIEQAMIELVAHNSPSKRAGIRMVLTGGEALHGLEHVPGRETLFIVCEPVTPLAPELYERGASLITHEHQRFMPEMKTINYITAVILQEKRKAASAIEILYTSNGRVLECATSNVAIVKDGTVITPDTGMLKGVTRKVMLEVVREAYPVEERTVSVDEFFSADEAFITSSFKDIVPIATVDARTIGSGIPGPVTKDLMKRFAAYAKTQ